MADGATDLSDLLGSGPVQNPQLPQSTTFAPIVTGGVDPFISPQNTSYQKPMTQQAQNHTFSTVRYAVKNFMVYFGFFAAAMLISLSTPRSMILQYIPNTYTAGGVPSYMGAGILAGVAVAIAYVLGTLFGSLF
uniref:Uncharacterized protein n=1 Tax=viral metagenome TaxID=1070528 RepID=A0A6C0EUE8_9ZZZZ